MSTAVDLDKRIYTVDASKVIKRYRAELYHGDRYDRGDPIWVSPDTYETVEEALTAARSRISVEEHKLARVA